VTPIPSIPVARATAEAAVLHAARPKGSQGTDAEELIRSFQAFWRTAPSTSALTQFIEDNPALLHATARPYGSALMWALEFGESAASMALLQAGAPIAAEKPEGETPLHLAARGGLDTVVVSLLGKGAPPAPESYWGTPMHLAAKNGHASTIKLLLAAGAPVTVHSRDHQYTPLHEAMVGRHKDAVAALVSGKAELDAMDDDGRTALHWGAFAYTPQAMHIYRRQDAPHDTVFQDPGPAVAMELLIAAGANVEAKDKDGDTPLHNAARLHAPRAAEMLLKHGAKRGSRNKHGQTPLDIATKNNDAAMIGLLKAP